MVQFAPGDVILKSEPFAHVILSSHVARVCARCWCALSPGSVTTCPGCPLATYCSPGCRDQDAEEHGPECTVMGNRGAALSDQLR